MSPPILQFDHVHKTYRVIEVRRGFLSAMKSLVVPKYRHIKAVRDVSLRIEEGELVGLIGENGAGKSTIVKMATGILYPTSGKILFDGLDVMKNRRRCAAKFGVTFGQRRALWWQLSAREGLEALGWIYHLKPKEIKSRINRLIDIFELEEFIDRPVRQLSLGQRIRCVVTSCFIHRPQIVFLDEPTIGMDALAKIKMREYLRKINQRDGVAIFLTSHDLFDVERVCERILILDKGRLILDDTFDSLRRRFCSHRVLSLNLGAPFDNDNIRDVEGIELMPVPDPWKLKIRFDPVEVPVMGLLDELQKKLDIIDFTVEDLPIDEFVAEIYRAQS